MTAREAYTQLVNSKKLVGKQAQYLGKLLELGSATSGEVLAALGVQNVGTARARFTELQGRGLIAEAGERRDPATGRRCIVWRPTGRTKPLDRERGHRVDGKAWKALALSLFKRLEKSGELGQRGSEIWNKAAEPIRNLGGAP